MTRLGIFGSFARGEASDESDIDLIVVFEENTRDLYSQRRTSRRIEQEVWPSPVDICREKYIKPMFKEQILAEAIYV
ncbi:nucleotidyltransferase family protein [Membranihabitans maritimus]|uniref:nucleotidyltransferase family protein n=1 Tax=Membranihabitans maritimus TaxID=2904244 RepID=UPI001EFFE3A1|nr:nucleotidyltransferase domain-containing protein [Membranihabitans maritimus]